MINFNYAPASWRDRFGARMALAGSKANAGIYQDSSANRTNSKTANSITLAANSPAVRAGDVLVFTAPNSGIVTKPPVGVFGTTADSIAGIVAAGYYPTIARKQSPEVYEMIDFNTITFLVDPAVQATVAAAVLAQEDAYLNKVVTFKQLATRVNGYDQVVDPTVASSGTNYGRIHSLSINYNANGTVREIFAEVTFIS